VFPKDGRNLRAVPFGGSEFAPDLPALRVDQQGRGDAAQTELLHREAGYFDENQRRMQYMELREDGYPIGSGMVESGCKRFRARFNAAGMRWSRAGLERLLPVRAAIMSHRFDDLWKAAYNPPPK
jgi:hypothetical protein